MHDLVSVIHRFARQEFLVRRLYAVDPEFKMICNDYADALRAGEVWADDETKAEEYQNLVRELEVEILQYISKDRRPEGGREFP